MAIKQGFITGETINGFKVQEYKCHSSNYRTRLTNRNIDYVVIHYTGNTKDTALNNCKYYAGAKRQASAHFFVDEKNIYQSVSIKNIAWHCGSSMGYKGACTNDNSIGIEMCCSGNYLVSSITQDNSLQLILYIWNQQGWGEDDVEKRLWRHYDCVKSNKKCPAQFVNNPTEWTNFKNKLKSLLNKQAKAKAVNLQQYGAYFNKIDRIAYIPMANPKGETVSAAAANAQWNGRRPDAICNAELFNMTTYQPSSGVVSPGQSYIPETLGIAFKDNKIPVLSWKNNINAPDWIGAYPILVRDSKRAFTGTPSGLGGNRARTAIAFNDNVFAIVYVTAKDGCSLERFADAIIERGFHTAINLDGGGSTACITPGVAYDQGRKVRGKIGLWVKGGTGNKLSANTTITQPSSSGMQQDKSKAKGVKLTITALTSLRLRKSAPSGETLEYLKYKSQVDWYGYYCYVNNQKWYYVKTPSGKTGYISASYAK